MLTSREMAESLARGDWAYFPSIVWKTSRVKSLGFNTSYAVALDLALLFDIALAGGSMVVVDDGCLPVPAAQPVRVADGRRDGSSFRAGGAAAGGVRGQVPSRGLDASCPNRRAAGHPAAQRRVPPHEWSTTRSA